MVSPNTRARLLQEARDHQEREGDAAAEIAEKREKMKRFEEQVQKQAAILSQLDAQDATISHEISYLDSLEQRLREPLPIGSERQGGGAQRAREREQRATARRRTELLQQRQAAQEARRAAEAAKEEAQGELYVLNGSIHAPELEVAESQREVQRIFNELAPPPPPAAAPAASTTGPQNGTNGTVSNGPDEERDNEDNGQ